MKKEIKTIKKFIETNHEIFFLIAKVLREKTVREILETQGLGRVLETALLNAFEATGLREKERIETVHYFLDLFFGWNPNQKSGKLLCPECDSPLKPIVQSSQIYASYNPEQFDAIRAGDFECPNSQCPGINKINKNLLANNGHRCYWEKDLV